MPYKSISKTTTGKQIRTSIRFQLKEPYNIVVTLSDINHKNSENTENPLTVLKFTEKVQKFLKSIRYNSDCIDSEKHDYEKSQIDSVKDKLNGGGDKIITERQIDLIDSLCDARSIDSKQFAYEKFGKDLKKLLGHEANTLIRNLQKQEDAIPKNKLKH